MSQEQIGGIIRAVLTAVVGYAAGKGWISAGLGGDIVAGLTTIAIAIWSTWTNRPDAIAK